MEGEWDHEGVFYEVIGVFVCAYVCMVRMCVCVCTHSHIQKLGIRYRTAHAYQACIHAYIYAYTHTYTHTHTYIHTYRSWQRLLSSGRMADNAKKRLVNMFGQNSEDSMDVHTYTHVRT